MCVIQGNAHAIAWKGRCANAVGQLLLLQTTMMLEHWTCVDDIRSDMRFA